MTATGADPGATQSSRISNRPSLNAFRKFGEVRNLLYYLREIGTYRGDVDTFPGWRRRGRPGRVPRCVGPPGRRAWRADAGPAAWAEAAGAAHAGAARVDLSRDARRRHVGRPSLPVVPHAPDRQCVVGSAIAAAVGDLCRADATRVAAPRDAAPASRGLLARLAPGRPRSHPVQSDEPAA